MRHTIEGKIFNETLNIWEDTELKVFKDNKWESVEKITLWKQRVTPIEYENKEIGAYATWYNDPSNSVMLHYITVDSSPVECLYRKEGDLTWGVVSLFEDKSFPNTSNRVKWFKLEGLQSDSIYETKLNHHEQIHKFKTMPSTFTRSIKAILVSDQMNSEVNFQTEGVQGLNTMHDNNIDVLVIAGDAVHDDGLRTSAWQLWWEKYFEIERSRNLMIPMIVCLGNHDGRLYQADGSFKSLLWNGKSSDVPFVYNFFSNIDDLAYGVIDIGDYFSFVFLNSYHTQPIVGTQTTWLNNTLDSRTNRCVFPFMHVSPYPTYYPYNEQINKWVREEWTPLFAQYGVKIAGSGHEHAHLVTKKVSGGDLDANGVVFTGQGHGMGNITRPTIIPNDTWYVDYLNNTQRGFDIIEFKVNGSIELKKVTLGGDIMYQKTL